MRESAIFKSAGVYYIIVLNFGFLRKIPPGGLRFRKDLPFASDVATQRAANTIQIQRIPRDAHSEDTRPPLSSLCRNPAVLVCEIFTKPTNLVTSELPIYPLVLIHHLPAGHRRTHSKSSSSTVPAMFYRNKFNERSGNWDSRTFDERGTMYS